MLKKANNQAGFTLLEMVLVVFIMSGLSLMAVSFVENEDSQFRYEETRDKLKKIRKAVLGDGGLTVNEQLLLSGYVLDNGLLPTSLKSLITLPTNYDSFALHNPVFDADPDAVSGINNDAGVVLQGSNEKLLKGYRAGGYLQASPGGTEFYDGWGNVGVAPNYGWMVTGPTASNTMQFTSLGFDNATGGVNYNADISVDIEANWLVNLEGWTLTVANRSGTDLAIDNGAGDQCARVSLLVFINDADQANAFNWKRLTSSCIAGNVATGSDGSCLDGDGDGLVETESCDAEFEVTFAAEAFQPAMLIPNGEHLAVLIIDDDTPHNGSSSEALCLGSVDCMSGFRTSKRITFIPNTLRPLARMVIR